MTTITFDDFLRVDMRLGTVIDACVNESARKPALILKVDFGTKIGTKKTSAQVAHHYKPEDLIGKRVVGVVNFPKKQIGPFMSEFLILGFADKNSHITLISPDHDAENGARLC